MKIITTSAFLCLAYLANAQTVLHFIKHDTITLKSAQCNWLVPPTPKTAVKKTNANTVSEWFLEAIKNGKLRATDPETGTVIPPEMILSWQTSADTLAMFDMNGNPSGYQVVVAELDPAALSAIKIQQDWYMDLATGKLSQQTRWIQLMKEVYNPSGRWIGYRAFCRIYY